jgi:hypothetical protein
MYFENLILSLDDSKVRWDSNAYWISPSGKIVPVGQTHIREVLDNPEAFGTTQEEVDTIYKRHKEKKGIEGKAREEIMTAMLIRGWIRIRYNSREDAYSIELNKLSAKSKDYLCTLANGLIQLNDKRKFSDVKIIEFASDYNTVNYSVQDLAKSFLRPRGNKMIKLTSKLRYKINETHTIDPYKTHTYAWTILDTDFSEIGVKERIKSSGLARLYDLMEKSAVAFITAFREYRTLSENLALNKKLESKIRSAGFGFIPIAGTWGNNDQPIQVDRTFAISRPQLKKEDLIGAALELISSDPEYDQESIMVVSGSMAEFYSPAGDLVNLRLGMDKDSRFRTSMLVDWIRGPKDRAFAFSCGPLIDDFTGQPTFIKPVIISNLTRLARQFWINKEAK